MHKEQVHIGHPAPSRHADYHRYPLACPRCDSFANINHLVEVPEASNGRVRLGFNPDGTPIVHRITTISAECLNGHTFAGALDQYLDKTVTDFLSEMEAWCGPSAPERTHYSHKTSATRPRPGEASRSVS